MLAWVNRAHEPTRERASEDAEVPALSPAGPAPPPDVEGGVGRRLFTLGLVIVVVVVVITLVPGLSSLRSRLAHGDPSWLALGVVLKVLSGLCYVAVFRSVFCRRMIWRQSAEIGFSELGANALVPTGGAGGLALGAWALRRGGMTVDRIARRSVAFFLLTSVPNILGVVIIGVGLASGALAGPLGLDLTLLPALLAIAAVLGAIASGRWAGATQRRLARDSARESRLARSLGALSEGVSESLALLRGGDPWLLVGLAGYLGFDIMVLWCTFHAFGSTPPFAIIWMAYLLGELGGLIPIPGGIGGVDLGLVGALVLYKVPIGEATAAVLAYRAIALLVPAILGAVAVLLLRRTLAREQLAVSNCSPGEDIEIIGQGRVRITA